MAINHTITTGIVAPSDNLLFNFIGTLEDIQIKCLHENGGKCYNSEMTLGVQSVERKILVPKACKFCSTCGVGKFSFGFWLLLHNLWVCKMS